MPIMDAIVPQKDQSSIGQEQLLSLMNQINKKMLAGGNYKKTLDLVFDSLDLVIPYDRIGIALLEGGGDEAQLRMKWVRSKVAVTHLNFSYSAPVKGSSLGQILATGKARIINDLIEYSNNFPDSLSTKLILKDGIRSSFTCPLKSGNQNIGVVFFSSCQPDTYKNEHVRTFVEIADELSMIVDYGRLRKDSENSREQMQNLSMVLHDLRSPLSTIQGFAAASLDEAWFQNVDPDGKAVFEIFLRNSKYMFDLLNELNEIGELERQPEGLKLEAVRLDTFYEEMVHFGKILAGPKEIVFSASKICGPSQRGVFDRHKIRRVLDNLFSNAIKYSNRGSGISFTAACCPSRVTFSVEDNGQGIPVSEQIKLFRRFGKTSVRPTEGETSTGLGLAIAKEIVQQHSGGISMKSETGAGSTFTFWIPLLPSEKLA